MHRNVSRINHVLRLTRVIALATVITLLLVFVGTVVAASIRDTTTVGPFVVDLVDVSNDLTTWVYAITLPEGATVDHALSHVSLGIDPACVLISPENSTVYVSNTTVASPHYPDVCGAFGYNCATEEYNVEWPANEPSYGQVLKFETYDAEGLSTPGTTNILVFTLEGVSDYNPAGMYFSTTSGTEIVSSTIAGPICHPTAVSFSGFSAASGLQTHLGIVGMVMVGGSVVVAGTRRRRKEH